MVEDDRVTFGDVTCDLTWLVIICHEILSLYCGPGFLEDKIFHNSGRSRPLGPPLSDRDIINYFECYNVQPFVL